MNRNTGGQRGGISELRRDASKDGAGPQWTMVGLSSFLFFVMIAVVLILRVGSNPGEEWHHFELQCLPQPPDQGGLLPHRSQVIRMNHEGKA